MPPRTLWHSGCMADAETSHWRDVEPEHEPQWFAAINALHADQEPSSRCPSCGRAQLRFFFLRFPSSTSALNRGGFWIWCPACCRFMHMSGSVPDWWTDVADIDGHNLTPQPEWLNAHWEAISARRADEPQ